MRWTSLLAAVLGAAACGCGGQYPTAPVAGRVTLNGKPVAGASVEFQPIGGKDKDPGPGSMAVTDADGKFVLKTSLPPAQDGAVVGKHRVRIYVYSGTAPAGADDGKDAGSGGRKRKGNAVVIPARYSSASELTVEVTAAGLPDHHFDLKSP